MKFSRTFNGTPGQKSAGTGGPDQIEYDLDQIAKNLDPTQEGGGITADNIPNSAITTIKIADDAVTDGKIGNRTVDPTLAGGNNTGTLTQILSWFGKVVKAITGKTNWFDTPSKSIEELVSYDAYLLSQLQGVVLNQIPDGTITYDKLDSAEQLAQARYAGITTNVGNDYVISSPAITSLVEGLPISILVNADSTGACTLDWCSTGAKAIKKANGYNAALKANSIYTLRYNGTNFILQGEGGSGDATTSDLLLGKTASVDAGDITGTMPNKVGSGTIITPNTTDQTIPQGYYGGNAGDGKVLGIPHDSQSYTTPGTYTFTVPAGVTQVTALIVGAGGGGGRSDINGSGAAVAGGGGGGGVYIDSFTVVPNEEIAVVVGAGGAGGYWNGTSTYINGVGGGNSSFGAYIAYGGGGGGGCYNYEAADGAQGVGGNGGGVGFKGGDGASGGDGAAYCDGNYGGNSLGVGGVRAQYHEHVAPGSGLFPGAGGGSGTNGLGVDTGGDGANGQVIVLW